jgi:hypothetical protein
MKILNIQKVVETNYYLETDDKNYPFYRTNGKGNWECIMGQSWEPVYNIIELQRMFIEKETLRELGF